MTEEYLVPWLSKFIEVPNLSRNFDNKFLENGLIEQAMKVCQEFAVAIDVKGFKTQEDIDSEKKLTPAMVSTVEATKENPKNIYVYSHLDKQPHMEGWREGLQADKAVREGDLLYGRGSVDDGYAFFSTLVMIKAMQNLGIPHDRYVIFNESDEESASRDVGHYMQKHKETIGTPDIAIAMDAGGNSTDYITCTNALRGVFNARLTVQTLKKADHSGVAGGIFPSSFRVARALLDRLEDSKTGRMPDFFYPHIPSDKYVAMEEFTQQNPEKHHLDALCEGVEDMHKGDLFSVARANMWEPCLEVTGADGFDSVETAGNVFRHKTELKLSIRLPPLIDPVEAFQKTKELLETNPPYNAHVTLENLGEGNGWASSAWREDYLAKFKEAHQSVFNTGPRFQGLGGSIPFVFDLNKQLPNSLVFVTGVVTKGSAMHCPNECLDLAYLKRFMSTMTHWFAEL